MFKSDDPFPVQAEDPFPVIPGSELLFSPSALAAPLLPPTPDIPVQSNPRKRQRASPGPIYGKNSSRFTSPELARKLNSDNSEDIIEALNYLLKKSVNHDINYGLGIGGEKVIEALVKLYDETIGWTHGNSKWVIDEDRVDDIDDLAPTAKTWECNVSPSNCVNCPVDELDWQSFCAMKFAPSTLNTASSPSHVPPTYLQNDENDKNGMQVLEIIIMVMRNLSYVQENMRFILHSFGMMRVLIGSLYFRNFYTGKELRGPKSERDDSHLALGNSSNNICLHAMNTFFNMAPFLDVTGRKMFLDLYLFDGDLDTVQNQTKGPRSSETVDIKAYINADRYGKIKNMAWSGLYLAKHFNAKDETLSRVPDGLFRPAVRNYVRASMALFPPLVGLLRVRTSRSVVISTLETIILLIDNPENREVLLLTPDALIGQLIHLLWIPRLGPDSLEYMDPIINSVSRVSAMKLLGGYDIAVDYEVRDRSIEILQKLTDLSDDLKKRAGRKIVISHTESYSVDVAKITNQPCTRLYDAVIPALTTNVGRDHTALFAARFLANLASVEENINGIQYAERKILKATTTTNSEISAVLFNDVLAKIV